MIAPILDEVSQEYSGRLSVAKVNIDENQATPSKYGVRGIPTLIFMAQNHPFTEEQIDFEEEKRTKLKKLKALLLDQSKVTDTGLQSLKSLSELTMLSLRGLNVTPQGVADFEAALPKCKVRK